MSVLHLLLSCAALMAFCMSSGARAVGGSLDVAFMHDSCGTQPYSNVSISLEPGCQPASHDGKCNFWSQAKCVAGICHATMFIEENCVSYPIGKMTVELGLCQTANPARQDGNTGFYNASQGQHSPC